MALFEADVRRIAPEAPQPAADRAPDALAEGTPEPLRRDLRELLGPRRTATERRDARSALA